MKELLNALADLFFVKTSIDIHYVFDFMNGSIVSNCICNIVNLFL
jgi:hypothetical protein